MTPRALSGYFTACSSVAGALIGLLFVAISLRYDETFGPSAPTRNKSQAVSSFVALVNALVLSLMALIPQDTLGTAAIVSGGAALGMTVRQSLRRSAWRDRNPLIVVLTLVLYAVQVVDGVLLEVHPRQSGDVYLLAYVVFAAFVAAAVRSWRLLLAEQDITPAPPADSPEASPNRASLE